jgi:hypothetical protein
MTSEQIFVKIMEKNMLFFLGQYTISQSIFRNIIPLKSSGIVECANLFQRILNSFHVIVFQESAKRLEEYTAVLEWLYLY